MDEDRQVALTDLAWLAGLWDGEGSVGIRIERKPNRPLRQVALTATAQMSLTHKPTVDHVVALLARMGIRGAGYTYQSRDPAKHLDAHFLRVPRLLDLNLMSRLLLPYAVLKREHWELMLDYTTSRLSGVDAEATGRLVRGGNKSKAYSEYEIALATRLHDLNLRGPAAIAKRDEWAALAASLKGMAE